MTITIPSLPPLDWTGAEGAAEYSDASETGTGGELRLTAAAGVDWTNDAFGGPQQHAATALGFVPDGDTVLSARVRVSTERTTFDAGALAIWGDRDHWAKLCFEYSPQGQAMVVSVVTNGYSDDCNSILVLQDAVYLRVARAGYGWAFHFSTDGLTWMFVRVFRLAFDGAVRVGFLAQAPMGETCTAVFDSIVYSTTVPNDFRDGS